MKLTVKSEDRHLFNKNDNRAVFLIFALLILIRLINIAMPILEGTATRQIQTAMVARNLYTGGFNILYPRVDFLGPGPGNLILEFPIYNFIIALLYYILGGVHEWAGRLVTILFYAGASILLYNIVNRLFDKKTAIISLVAFGLSPLSIIYSRAIMPDFPSLCFSIGAIYFMLKYAENDRVTNFWTSCVFAMFALLIKPQSFYIAVPLAYLFWHKSRWKLFIKPSTWFYLIAVLLPTFVWLSHGKSVHAAISTQEAYNFKLNNWFDPALMLSARYYKNVWEIVINWALSPLGFALFFIGLFIRLHKPIQRVIWYWLLGIVVYYVTLNTHVMGQSYYHLTLVPVASIFIALACGSIFSKDFIKKSYLSNRLVLIIAILLAAVTISRYAAYAFVVPRGYRHIPALAKKLESMTDKSELLIVSVPSGHAPLYYSHRKGWSFTLPGDDPKKTEKAIEHLEELRRKGAKYFVSVCDNFLDESPDFKKYLKGRYKITNEEPGLYTVYSLK